PWRELTLRYRQTETRRDLRGVGLIEAVRAIRKGSQPRASGELAFHVLDVMLSILESNESGRRVTICSTCIRHALIPLAEGVVAECKDWGCEHVVVPSVPEADRSPEGYARFAEQAGELAGRLKGQGLGLAYHNHAYELERYGDQTGLEMILSASSPPLDAELDTYWLQFGGANPATWIRRFKDRVPLVHLKDVAVVRGNPVDAEIGEGNLAWMDILGACREARTKWLAVEQDNQRRDPMERVAI